jgi:hypothetical protein
MYIYTNYHCKKTFLSLIGTIYTACSLSNAGKKGFQGFSKITLPDAGGSHLLS